MTRSPFGQHALNILTPCHHCQAYALLCGRVLGASQETMIHIVRVKGSRRDCSGGVEAIDGKNNGALAGACARVRSIKCSDGAVQSAQEAVTYIARISVASRDRRRRVDVAGAGTLAG